MLRQVSRLSSNALAGVRSFAAAAAESKPAHQPPVSLHHLAGRYASALYTAASKKGALKKVEEELIGLQSLAGESSKFRGFLLDPTIARKKKAEAMEAILQANKTSDLTRSLFTVLARNGRLHDTEGVIESFRELMVASRNEVNVVIVSAEPLKADQLDSVKKSLESLVEKGTTANVSTKVDPSILGGLKIHMGDRFVDLSVATRIRQLSTVLKSGDSA